MTCLRSSGRRCWPQAELPWKDVEKLGNSPSSSGRENILITEPMNLTLFFPMRIIPCVCVFHVCAGIHAWRLGEDTEFCFIIPCTEPGARLPAWRTQRPSCFYPTAHMWSHLAVFWYFPLCVLESKHIFMLARALAHQAISSVPTLIKVQINI